MKAFLAHARLLIDIFSMKLFLRLIGQSDDLLDAHLFFFERYSDLAEYHRSKGRLAKADRLTAIAEAHYEAAPGDDHPPEAAAMAMPNPPRRIHTNVVSTMRLDKPPIRRVKSDSTATVS